MYSVMVADARLGQSCRSFFAASRACLFGALPNPPYPYIVVVILQNVLFPSQNEISLVTT